MEDHRTLRVAEAIREELTEMIDFEMADPRITNVSVTEVLIDPRLKEARVRLSMLDAETADETLAAIERARHFLRSQLAMRLQLRRTPELHFEADKEISPTKIEQLLKRVKKGRPRD
jgi:ribosome-binding factor A